MRPETLSFHLSNIPRQRSSSPLSDQSPATCFSTEESVGKGLQCGQSLGEGGDRFLNLRVSLWRPSLVDA